MPTPRALAAIFAAANLALGLGTEGRAKACGNWQMTDHERNRAVSIDISYIRTSARPNDKNAYMMPIASINGGEDPLSCYMKTREVVIRGIRNPADKDLRATIDAGHWRVGRRDFEVAIVDRGESFRPWRWHVIVKDKDAPIATGDAASFSCVHGGFASPDEERQDVARTLLCYLMAREQPAMKLSDMPWNKRKLRKGTKKKH